MVIKILGVIIVLVTRHGIGVRPYTHIMGEGGSSLNSGTYKWHLSNPGYVSGRIVIHTEVLELRKY